MTAAGLVARDAFAGASVLVEWTTASELDTAGFNLYRSLQSSGPYEKVNSTLIPAKGDSLAGGEYRYQDKPVQSGQVYYYQLEEIELDGGSGRFGPISVQSKGRSPGWAAALLCIIAFILFTAWLIIRRMRSRDAASPDRSAEEQL